MFKPLGSCGLVAAATLFLFPYVLRAQSPQLPWRSQLYPVYWEPPVFTPFTALMLQDWSYAGAFQGQPLPLRTGPVFDAVAYGADPTGAKDSTLPIQRAIDAAGVTGGIVFLREGTYRIRTEPEIQ